MAVGKSKGRWKQAEREVAGQFGTRRIPNSGFGQPDIILDATDRHPTIAIQVKTRAVVPAWFTDAMKQATLDANNTDGEAIPAVVIVHAPGAGIKKQRFAVIRLEDAVQLLGTPTAPASDGEEGE